MLYAPSNGVLKAIRHAGWSPRLVLMTLVIFM
jgi:hypothetical protein